MSAGILAKEAKGLMREKWVNLEIDDENIHIWNLALIVVNPDSLYYGGYFRARMTFPKEYPYQPPEFRFIKSIWHPNVYEDGRLCISILHSPGEDMMSGEAAGERWSPAQRVESVLISILSLLDDPEISSPANVDASVMYRDRINEFKTRVQMDVADSKKDMPDGFVLPTHESTKPVVEKFDDDFWQDSDAEADFDFDDDDVLNGSESDTALNNESEDEDEDLDDGDDAITEEHDHDNLDSDMTEPES